jgi:hypothetical protein
MKNKFISASGLNDFIPIYTTRPHGKDKETASWGQSAWITISCIWIISLNIIGWGIYGLVELVFKVI